jgi:hypothetical protein
MGHTGPNPSGAAGVGTLIASCGSVRGGYWTTNHSRTSRRRYQVAQFITIGYGDESGYTRTGADLKDAAHAHDAWLVERGAIVGMAGTPIQVRNHENGGIRTDQGAYLGSELPIAGLH